jgi:branched-chain amino acid transport system substrate-binding protein
MWEFKLPTINEEEESVKPFRHISIAALSLLLVALMLAVACAPAAPAPAPAAPAAPATGPAVPEVKIGLIAPMTGDVKTFGESTKNAFDIAVEEANRAGKVKITYIVADDKNDATEGTNAATKLINQDNVNAIVGSVASKVSIPISEVAQKSKILQISPTSTNEKVTIDGVRKDYVFRACFIDPFQGLVMAKFASGTLGAKTAAIMYDKGNDYTVGLAENFKAAFEKAGGKVISEDSYGKDDVDFSAILTKMAAANPDFLFLPDYYNKVNLIAQQAREKGVKAAFGGGDGWDSADLDTKAVDGGYYSNHYSPEATTPEVVEWVQKYQAKHNSVPDALATLGYDATNLLISAIERAGSSDSTAIRDAMTKTDGFKAVSGSISFDPNGNPIKSAVVIQVKDGEHKYVETVNP